MKWGWLLIVALVALPTVVFLVAMRVFERPIDWLIGFWARHDQQNAAVIWIAVAVCLVGVLVSVR